MPDANLALVSVPGDFAAAEARKALRRGLNVMIFSDNVPLEQEIALKREARDLGLIVMGPDCGTAIIAGVPLAFANAVPRGDIGIIGASGTGIQEVSCLIANAGRGISHALGTGGRDLSAEVGGIATLTAIDLLDRDAATRHVVLISKPPAPQIAKLILDRVGSSPKPFTVCLIGGADQRLNAGECQARRHADRGGRERAGARARRLSRSAAQAGRRQTHPRPLLRRHVVRGGAAGATAVAGRLSCRTRRFPALPRSARCAMPTP